MIYLTHITKRMSCNKIKYLMFIIIGAAALTDDEYKNIGKYIIRGIDFLQLII